MSYQYTFDEFKNSVIFHGIGIKEFQEGVFYAVFEIDGTPFFIDDICYRNMNGVSWDVRNSRIYHYTVPSEESQPYECRHCKYIYEEGKMMSEELLCEMYNREPFITAIWGACVFSEHFEETFNDLILQLNPMGIKSRNEAERAIEKQETEDNNIEKQEEIELYEEKTSH